MKVGLDATPLAAPAGGIRRYLVELSAALGRVFAGDEYVLLTDQPAPPPGAWFARRWWSIGLPLELARRGIDVFHGVDFAVPYVPLCPSVLTLHDLSPWMDPAWHCAAGRVRRRAPALIGLGLATMILTPGEVVRRQAIEQFHLSPARVAAVPLAASAHFRPIEGRLRPRPYFLYVGTLEPRKNLELIIGAWRELRRQTEIDLVLAGRRREDFAARAPEPGLDLAGFVPEDDLPALYSGAAAFLYPSHYEGFGLPVLEAMQCGAPVIVSRDAAIAEVAGDATVRLDAGDHRGWVEAMRAALEDEQWRSRRREASQKQAQRFSWERTARLTREVYEEAIRRFGA
jgi:glycosyltransferase involved in cell wall biosynthesis